MRTLKAFFNSSFALLYRLVLLFSGFFVSRLLLENYGSSINGMVSSIKQFVSYLSLFEAGIAGASIYALYKPLAENNDKEISQILSDAKRYYKRSGIAVSIACIGLAIFYVSFAGSKEIDKLTMFLVFLILSVNTALDFFAFAKYRVIFTADQREYVISICNIIHTIVYCILTYVAVRLDANIVLMQLTVIGAFLVRSIFLYLFYRSIYADRFDFNITTTEHKVPQKTAVLFHEICFLVLSSSPMIIMTISKVSFKMISVYSVYNLISSNIVTLIAIFNSSLTAGFGELISKKLFLKFNKAFHEFELFYYILASFVFVCTLLLIQSFVNVYTSGITDISYNNKLLYTLLILLGMCNCLRVPPSILISITGSFNATIKSTIFIIIFTLAISWGLSFVGFEYILIGSIIGYILRSCSYIYKASQLNINYDIKKTIKNLFISGLAFIISFILCSLFLEYTATTYLMWIKEAIITVIICALVFYILIFILSKNELFSLINRFKNLLFMKKAG